MGGWVDGGLGGGGASFTESDNAESFVVFSLFGLRSVTLASAELQKQLGPTEQRERRGVFKPIVP